METMLIFLTLSVFIFGGLIVMQLYVLRKKRKDADETRAQLEQMLVRKCRQSISKYRMQFYRAPKTDLGFLTQVRLSHEASMPEFFIAFGDMASEVLGYAKFTQTESHGHRQTYTLTEILPAGVEAPYPVMSLDSELYTLDEAVRTRETIDTTINKIVDIRAQAAAAN